MCTILLWASWSRPQPWLQLLGGHKLEPWAQQSVLLSFQAASGAQAELKVMTVKALRALALGNPASLLSSV